MSPTDYGLFTAEQARTADSITIQSGVSGVQLMENAASSVSKWIMELYKPCPVVVLCGPGNNGGDGFAIARLLKEAAWPVQAVASFALQEAAGDAAMMLSRWCSAGGQIPSYSPALFASAGLIVDALFGTGLNRPLEGHVRRMVEDANHSGLPIIAVDMASGIHTDTGEVLGAAIRAAHTVTFVRAKPGHILLPGKLHTGSLHIADIGIDKNTIIPVISSNNPELWSEKLAIPKADSHKYTRGHSVIIGGGKWTSGAARMSAMAALRAGSGLVSIVCEEDALPYYGMHPSIMTKPSSMLTALLDDRRVSATLIGPGAGVNQQTRETVLALLASTKPTVLDADALTCFADNPDKLFYALQGECVLTPHEGEFARLFKCEGSKWQRAQTAAKQSGCIIVLKGSDTVIASPDGRCVINCNAPPWLATAGSGDMLAGIICGLIAQGMSAFEAACAGVWMHGEAANLFGPGLIAEDIPAQLPQVWRVLLEEKHHE